MSVKSLFCGAMLLVGASLVPAQADDELRAAFLRGLESVSIEDALQLYDLPPHLQPVMREHLEVLMGSAEVKGYLVAEMELNAAYLMTGTDMAVMRNRARDFSAAIVQDSTIKGVRRLPLQDQRAFYGMALEMISAAPVGECAALVGSTLTATETQAVEMRALGQMPPSFVRNHMALARKALLAEIRKEREPLPLTPSERAVAEAAFTEKLIQAVSVHPQAQEILAAVDGTPDATDVGRCAMGLESIKAALAVEGVAAEWTLRLLSE